jgi:hypothetical protein
VAERGWRVKNVTVDFDRSLGDNGLSFVRRIGTASALLWVVAILGALPHATGAAAGLAIGGALTLGFFALHLALARRWLRQSRPSGRLYLWALWLVKWPAVGAVLYLAITSGLADPLWLCVGAAIIPLTTTIFALPLMIANLAGREAAGGAS